MSRVLYTAKRFGGASLEVISQANAICAEYQLQGYDLTLRQLYYQFVARGLIANRQSEYKRLGSIINDARLAGKLDWDFIVDRTRNVEIPLSFEDPADRIEKAANNYAIDRWEDQPYRVEVWVEKEALAGVVERSAALHRVPTFSCRGYVSQSELWGAAQRLQGYLREGQVPVIIHLGDHDPSGIDMTRDIWKRLRLFLHQDWFNDVMPDDDESSTYSAIRDHMAEQIREMRVDQEWDAEVIEGELPVIINRIALNMDQIDLYDPPPNPTKLTDSRAEGYVEEFGNESWELDALDPGVLNTLIRDTIEDYLDGDRYEVKVEREKEERDALKEMAAAYRAENEEEE